MLNVKKILAPTDFSDASSVGVLQALDLAEAENAEMILFHVIGVSDEWFASKPHTGPVRDLVARETERLSAYLESVSGSAPKAKVTHRVELGHPAINIIDVAKRESVDLIVMATHGRSGLAHMIMGSVTEKVVALAPCPVLTLPPVERRRNRSAR